MRNWEIPYSIACQNVVRYYKQNADETWVDVSLNSLLPGSVLNCQRQLSGCLIQEKPNGYSKVEHVEVDDRSVHNIYKLLGASNNSAVVQKH